MTNVLMVLIPISVITGIVGFGLLFWMTRIKTEHLRRHDQSLDNNSASDGDKPSQGSDRET